MTVDPVELSEQAQRIYLRYAVELVEALSLCPWAAQARADGRVQLRVLLGEPELPTALATWHALEQDPSTDIALLLFPQATLSRLDFAHFGSRLQEADAASKPRGRTLFALAEFHPDVRPDLRSPERLVPFVRRSPDPTLQLVRRSALEAVRLGADQGTRFVDARALADPSLLPTEHEPLARRVARANMATVERLGAEHLEAIMQDILEDRKRSYGRLGVAPPPWTATSLKRD